MQFMSLSVLLHSNGIYEKLICLNVDLFFNDAPPAASLHLVAGGAY
jgi:hypothetical protein